MSGINRYRDIRHFETRVWTPKLIVCYLVQTLVSLMRDPQTVSAGYPHLCVLGHFQSIAISIPQIAQSQYEDAHPDVRTEIRVQPHLHDYGICHSVETVQG